MLRSAVVHGLMLLAAVTFASPAVKPRDTPQGTNTTHLNAVHNTVISARCLERSLRFYVDGLGLTVIRNYTFQGDLPTLFGTSTSVLPGYFLGDTTSAYKGTAGVIYLVEFPDSKDNPVVESDPPNTGLFLTSFWVGDRLNETLARLEKLGMGGKPNIATFAFASEPLSTYATIRDPDGARVLLANRPYINSEGTEFPP